MSKKIFPASERHNVIKNTNYAQSIFAKKLSIEFQPEIVKFFNDRAGPGRAYPVELSGRAGPLKSESRAGPGRADCVFDRAG